MPRLKRTATRIAAFLAAGLGVLTLGAVQAEQLRDRRGLAYRVEYSSASHTDFRPLFSPDAERTDAGLASAATIHFQLRGLWEWTTLDSRSAGRLIAASFRDLNVQITVNNRPMPEKAMAISRELRESVFVQFDQQGRVLAAALPPQLDPVSSATIRVLLGGVQLSLPDGKTPANWESVEEDANGKFTARYELVSSAPEGANPPKSQWIRKTRLRYIPPRVRRRLSSSASPPTVEPGGSLTIQYDVDRNRITALGGTESQLVMIADRKVGQATNQLALQFAEEVSTDRTAVNALAVLAETARRDRRFFPLSVDPAAAQLELNRHRAELKGASLDDLLTELDRIERAADQRAEMAVALKFEALGFLDPSCCQALVRRVEGQSVDSAAFRIIPAALARIGHQPAQDALLVVFRARSSDEAALLWLIPLAGRLSFPSVEMESAVRAMTRSNLSPEVRSAAELALGAMAWSLLDAAPERAAAIVRDYADRLTADALPGDARRALLVLGNAGSDRALLAISRYLSHEEPSLRAEAVYALRRIDDPEAESLLLTSLRDDPSALVRVQAAAALSVRVPTDASIKEQRNSMAGEPSPQVRIALLENLWSARAHFPDVMQFFQAVAREDAEKEVREAASRLLRQASTSDGAR